MGCVYHRSKLILVLIMSFMTFMSSAQDIHFSQFYASPLTLNPALTGLTNCTYRGAAIYRSQWRSISSPYVTIGSSFDMNLLKGKINNDYIGVGLLFTDDFAGSSSFTSMQAMGSFAYHKALGRYHQISAGIQLGLAQKSVNLVGLTFPNQVNGTGTAYDPSLPNSESIGNSLSYFDYQAGLFYFGQINDLLRVFNGVSLHHLTQPEESFMGATNKIPMRITSHGGLTALFSNNWKLTSHYIVLIQANALEINLGSAIEFDLPDNSDPDKFVSVGGYYRFNDAFVFVVGVGFINFSMGISYDINLSSLNTASNYKGGLELSLVYEGCIEKAVRSFKMECPKW